MKDPILDFPGALGRSSLVHFTCAEGCGWYHPEDAATDPLLPIVVPADPTPKQISDAITANANRLADERRERVWAALTQHYAEHHPEEV